MSRNPAAPAGASLPVPLPERSFDELSGPRCSAERLKCSSRGASAAPPTVESAPRRPRPSKGRMTSHGYATLPGPSRAVLYPGRLNSVAALCSAWTKLHQHRRFGFDFRQSMGYVWFVNWPPLKFATRGATGSLLPVRNQTRHGRASRPWHPQLVLVEVLNQLPTKLRVFASSSLPTC